MHNDHQENEYQQLISDRTSSKRDGHHHRPQTSRLEWAETSRTRFLHILCWWWMNPVLSLGSKQSLSENDLDELPAPDKASALLNRLHSYDWLSSTTTRIIIREFWKEYLRTSLLYFPYLITRLAQPLLLRLLVLNMDNDQISFTNLYLYGLLLFTSVLAHTSISRIAAFRSIRVGTKIRNALTSTIYEHVLSINTTSLQQTNTGQMINLITTDAYKFVEMCKFSHYLWEAPVEAMIIFGLLCWIIGLVPALVGSLSLVLLIIVEIRLSLRFQRYHATITECNDRRVHAFHEFIHACHIIKMYNWEKLMENRIRHIRDSGFATIRRVGLLRAINMTQQYVLTSLLSLSTFGSAWLLNYPLDAANVFSTLVFFAGLRINLGYYFPMAIETLGEVRSASTRIDSLMRLRVKQPQQQKRDSLSIIPTRAHQKGHIIMLNASFSWHNELVCLSSLSLSIEQGTLVGIVGPVGCGKSSLLNAVLGEMNLIDGQLDTSQSAFSYAAQSPWIFNDTLRNNILLNRPFDSQRYRNVIHICCLEVELTLLGAAGDLTIIGDRGVNLSGGQKARVSLARALYADADIYLFDDPFASVDGTVAREIFERGIGSRGLLKDKTRLLITHQTQFLIEAHQTIFLSHGRMNKQQYLVKNNAEEHDGHRNETSKVDVMFDEHTSTADAEPITSEEAPTGSSAHWSVCWHLFSATPFGKLGLCLLIVSLLLGEICYDSANYWLSVWIKQSHFEGERSAKFAYIYFSLVIATVLADGARTICYFSILLHGVNSLHHNMLKGLLYTSTQFFESNPNGRILNRVSKDQQVVDETLPVTLLNALRAFLLSVGSVTIICCVNLYILPLFALLLVCFWIITRFYLRSSRQIKRLECVSRSPVYSMFSSSLDGLSTIRAFKAKEDFTRLFNDRVDINTRACLNVEGASQWYATRLDMMSYIVMLVAVILLIFSWNQMQPSTAALVLMYALTSPGRFHWTILQVSDVDSLLASAERLDEYAQLPREEDDDDYKRMVKTSPEWPSDGTIEFRNYSLRHRPNLDYALKNLNLRIESSQKIGIIGRTGAGKSSLFKGIFRFLHRSNVEGHILIDGVDINRISRSHLRSHLSVIPQQPVSFSGTLRYNLDPFNQYTDQQCWMALEDVQLTKFVSDHSSGLLMPIAEAGSNLSVGQCQLMSIARVILKKTKILLVDEATAHVDQQTDRLIQKIIADKFRDRTVITIAHRLSTIANSDRIIVLDKGSIVDDDIPNNILHSYQ